MGYNKSMTAQKNIKQARRQVGNTGVSKIKTAARRHDRRMNRNLLRRLGEDYESEPCPLTEWEIS